MVKGVEVLISPFHEVQSFTAYYCILQTCIELEVPGCRWSKSGKTGKSVGRARYSFFIGSESILRIQALGFDSATFIPKSDSQESSDHGLLFDSWSEQLLLLPGEPE